MMSFNYIGHMAVEAEKALKDQIVRISAQNIFLFIYLQHSAGSKESLVGCEAKETESSEILLH